MSSFSKTNYFFSIEKGIWGEDLYKRTNQLIVLRYFAFILHCVLHMHKNCPSYAPAKVNPGAPQAYQRNSDREKVCLSESTPAISCHCQNPHPLRDLSVCRWGRLLGSDWRGLPKISIFLPFEMSEWCQNDVSMILKELLERTIVVRVFRIVRRTSITGMLPKDSLWQVY